MVIFKDMNGEKKKILIVDDDVFTRDVYADVFRNAGYDVFEASDGIEGVDMATKNIPDVIFTGIVMPRMDGFTLIETLRKSVMTSKIPVFMSSHLGREEDRERAKSLGVKEFIVRDFTTPMDVVDLVGKALSSGGEYILDFDKNNFDAQRLAHDIHINERFQCLECDESMVLKLRIGEHGMNMTQFVCPRCGWRKE